MLDRFRIAVQLIRLNICGVIPTDNAHFVHIYFPEKLVIFQLAEKRILKQGVAVVDFPFTVIKLYIQNVVLQRNNFQCSYHLYHLIQSIIPGFCP